MDDESWVTHALEELGCSVDVPSHWLARREDDVPALLADVLAPVPVYAFWDEYTGTLRISFWAKPSSPLAFTDRLALQHPDAEWTQLGSLRFLGWREQPGATVLHHFVGFHGDRILHCSWAYGAALLDDELSADEVESETENARAVLASIRPTAG